MPKKPAPSPAVRTMRTPRIVLLPLCLSVVLCSACLVKKRPAAHFGTLMLAHPVIPSPKTEEALNEAPDLGLELAPMPSRLGPPRNPPARPKVAALPPAAPAAAGRPSEPTIVPELSTGELEAAKADAQASLDVAERNLAAARGKALNAAQADLASKIRGFLDVAREAIRNNDWHRATNMAKKAEVLSRELAGGL